MPVTIVVILRLRRRCVAGGSWRVAAGPSRLLTTLVGAWGRGGFDSSWARP